MYKIIFSQIKKKILYNTYISHGEITDKISDKFVDKSGLNSLSKNFETYIFTG